MFTGENALENRLFPNKRRWQPSWQPFMWSIRPHIQVQWWNPWRRFGLIWPHLTPGLWQSIEGLGWKSPEKKKKQTNPGDDPKTWKRDNLMNDEAKSCKIIILDNCLVFLLNLPTNIDSCWVCCWKEMLHMSCQAKITVSFRGLKHLHQYT